MKNRMNKSIWVIFIIFFSTLFLHSTINETHGNLRDAESLFKQGNDYLNKHEYDQAISDYNKALDINPDMAPAYNNRGIAYGSEGRYDQAIDDYTKALEIKLSVQAYDNRGYAYVIEGQYDRAISDFNKALEINPKYAAVYNNRGCAYFAKGQYKRAISDFDQALEIKLNPEVLNNRAWAYYFEKAWDKSWDDVEIAEELGYQISPILLEELRRASGREK